MELYLHKHNQMQAAKCAADVNRVGEHNFMHVRYTSSPPFLLDVHLSKDNTEETGREADSKSSAKSEFRGLLQGHSFLEQVM